MAPELNDDVEKVLLFCDKGASEDFGGDKVDDEGGNTDEASDIEVGVEVGGVDIRDGEELISLVVVAFDEMLLRLLDWEVVECEEVDVEISDRILMTVIVVGSLSPLLLSTMGETTISFTIGALPRRTEVIGEIEGWSFEDSRSQASQAVKAKRLPAGFLKKNGDKMDKKIKDKKRTS
jgi:hypothetical protein